MYDASVKLKYDVNNDSFEVDTNVKNPIDFISTFIRMQIGKGNDTLPANDVDNYQIDIHLDLSEDVYFVSHNCGNKGLRDEILMAYIDKNRPTEDRSSIDAALKYANTLKW